MDELAVPTEQECSERTCDCHSTEIDEHLTIRGCRRISLRTADADSG